MRKSVEEMTGEALREIGTLILVFATLDRLVSSNLTFLWTLTASLLSVLLFAGGCYLKEAH